MDIGDVMTHQVKRASYTGSSVSLSGPRSTGHLPTQQDHPLDLVDAPRAPKTPLLWWLKIA